MIMAKLKFGQVERQIFSRDVVIGAHNAALQQAPKRFDVIRVHDAAHVLARFVIDHPMRIHTSDVLHCRFPGIGRSATVILLPVFPMPIGLLAADVGFVNFDDAHQLLEAVVVHRRAEPMADEPSGMCRRSLAKEHAPNLESRNAFFALQHRVEHLEPRQERDVGILENRPDENGEAIRVGVLIGLVPALPMEGSRRALIDLVVAADRALWARRPSPQRQVSPAGRFVRESRHQFLEGLHERKYSVEPICSQVPSYPQMFHYVRPVERTLSCPSLMSRVCSSPNKGWSCDLTGGLPPQRRRAYE